MWTVTPVEGGEEGIFIFVSYLCCSQSLSIQVRMTDAERGQHSMHASILEKTSRVTSERHWIGCALWATNKQSNNH